MTRQKYLKYIFLKISFAFFIGIFQSIGQAYEPGALDLLKRIDSAVQASDKMEFKARLFARMKGADYKQIAFFRIQRNPLKIYYRQFQRNQIELLYDETLDKNRALVNPAGFPYANIKLSPYSSLILNRQHHSFFESDPAYMLNEINYMLKKCNAESELMTRDTVINSFVYKVIEYKNNGYSIETKIVDKKTDLLNFAQKHHVNFYSLVEENDGFSVSTELEKGARVRVPSCYATRVLLLVSPAELKVKGVTVFDRHGIFESYYYIYFKNKQVFLEGTFNKNNPEYNF